MDLTSPTTKDEAVRRLDKYLKIYQGAMVARAVERGDVEVVHRPIPRKWKDDDYKSKWTKRTLDDLLEMWAHLKEELVEDADVFNASLIDSLGDGVCRTSKSLSQVIGDILFELDEKAFDSMDGLPSENYKRPSTVFFDALISDVAIRAALESVGWVAKEEEEEEEEPDEGAGECAFMPSCLSACLPVCLSVFLSCLLACLTLLVPFLNSAGPSNVMARTAPPKGKKAKAGGSDNKRGRGKTSKEGGGGEEKAKKKLKTK